jgi:hypothetical protein
MLKNTPLKKPPKKTNRDTPKRVSISNKDIKQKNLSNNHQHICQFKKKIEKNCLVADPTKSTMFDNLYNIN